MIKFKLQGKSFDFPSCWEDLTFFEYCEILKGNGDLFNLLQNRLRDTIILSNNTVINGLESLVLALSFMKKPPVIPDYVSHVGKFELPATKDGRFDIQFESLAQFEDMRKVLEKLPKDDIVALTESYGDIVGIYLQKIKDGAYDFGKAQSFRYEVDKMPALEVISAGSFFFIKLIGLLNGISPTSQTTPPTPKKSKPVSKSSAKSSAPSARSPKRRSR